MQEVVKITNVSKAFPGVQALANVDFSLNSGEVMALLGENGAGKSTLMKILSGVYTKDSGKVEVFGKTVEELNPKSAQELGVAIIHQELNLCPHLTVAENIFLGREKTSNGLYSDKEMNREAQKYLDQLNIDIKPEQLVSDLSISKQQMIEIAKALSHDASILIMDEPTSALTTREIEQLFEIINKLKAEGKAIVYISHRMDELKHITDRVSIMRDGEMIGVFNFSDISMDQIIEIMVGRELNEKFPQVACEVGETILEIKNLNAGKLVRDISFSVKKGEILGIAGLMGSGRTETTRAIFGVDRKESGNIFLNGKEVKINSPIDAIKAGIVLAPEDRKRDGLCTKLSIRENISLPNLDIISNAAGVINSTKENEIVKTARDTFQVKMSSAEANADSLSGGNQQKLVVGKWMVRDSKVVIFDEPTRGIDVGAKVEIFNLMNDLKEKGIGVFFVSSEMEEVIGMADRIIVMCDGKITGEFYKSEVDQKVIMAAATKFDKKVS